MNNNNIFIIAEAGVNHNGSMDLAKELIHIAAETGANAVKFQTFKAENNISKSAPMAEYQKVNIKKNMPQLDLIKKLELPYEKHFELIEECKRLNLEFMTTAFDLDGLEFIKTLNLKRFKIPSGEITNLPYLKKISEFDGKIILSTGMSTLDEVRNALEVLTGNKRKKDSICVLHCTTEYPAPFEDVNLNAMLSLKRDFGVEVGYSDHTMGIEVPIAAAALGAKVIEKHFTKSRGLEGPDHKASLEPEELKQMILGIRRIELAMGNGVKEPKKSEEKNILIARKSIVAKKLIKKGELFSEDNITAKRPGTGISPMKWYEVINQRAEKDFNVDDLIEV